MRVVHNNRSEIKMYTDDGGSPYYGARNEKENGVLFGVCANGATRSRLDNESMVLVYQEIGDSLSSYNKNIVQAASEQIPYTAYIDASDFSGAHTLEAVAEFENGQTLIRSDNIIIADKAKDISVKISGETVSFDRKPVLYHGRTLVPMRKIFESLGTEITWNSDTQTVHGKKDGRSIAVSVGSRVMRVDGNIVMLDIQPIVVSDRTLVPVREIAEGLGCGVEWDQRSASVFIEPK